MFAGFKLDLVSFVGKCKKTPNLYNEHLKIGKDIYFRQNRDVKNYDDRNRTTAHVHMILNGDLAKMINNTECLIFMDTPNSLRVEELDISLRGESNDSCWIYSELLMSRLIKPNVPNRIKNNLLVLLFLVFGI